jgi:ribosome-associated protein
VSRSGAPKAAVAPGVLLTLGCMDGNDDLRTPGGLVVPAPALMWSFTRASGPGGQHVNKTSSRVTLSIDAASVLGSPDALSRLQKVLGTGLRVSSQTSRSQSRNRQLCLERATRLLDDAAAPPDPPRRKSKPTRGSVERRLDSKRRESEKKASRRSTEW